MRELCGMRVLKRSRLSTGENMPCPCWLCEYSDDPLAKNLTKFICEQAVTMGPDILADKVHEALVESIPSANGIGLESVKQHISLHMLNPSVRVGCMLRSLLKLSVRALQFSSLKPVQNNPLLSRTSWRGSPRAWTRTRDRWSWTHAMSPSTSRWSRKSCRCTAQGK